MLKNTLSAALVLAIVGTGALVAPPVAASAAPVLSSSATISDADLDGGILEHGDDMREVEESVPDTAVSRRNLAKAESLTEKAGTVANPEVHPLYFAIAATTTQTSDDDITGLDETTIRSTVDKLNEYWFAESGGTVRFTFGGYQAVSVNATTCNTNSVYQTVPQTAFNGIFANSSWAGTSRHLIILSKEKVACDNGQAFGSVSGGIYSGGLIFSSVGTDLVEGVQTLQHELGHNLGFRHASASICRSTTNFDSTINQFGLGALGQGLDNTTMQCPTEDYGDLLDIMGYTVQNSSPHLSTPLRITNNYMTDYATATPSAAGTFTIAPINNTATGSAVRALRIKDPTTGEYYYVEYRTKVGTDNQSYSWYQSPDVKASVDGYSLAPYDGADAVTNGAVRIQRLYSRQGFFGSTVLAVAPTRGAPSNLQVRRPFLVPGQSFTNDKGVFTVTVNQTNQTSGATLSVSFRVPTTTTLTVTPSTQNYGSTAVAEGTVAPIDGVNVPGTMTITADGSTVGSGAVSSSGKFSVNLPASLSIGSHSIKASFAPSSSTYVASESATSTLTVNAVPTTTTLSLSNSATQAYDQGTRVTATASVGQVNGTYPAGSIEFRDGSTVLATTATNASGSATHTFAATTTVGTHSITARFIPNASTVASSTSSASTLTVTATPTSVGLTLDRSGTQVFGSSTPVTAQASVAELTTGGYAPGSIEFRDGSTVRATVPVNASGIASYTFSATLGTGNHDITARFVPTSSNLAASTSAVKILTVTASSTSTTLTLDKSGSQTFGSPTRVVATASVAQVGGEYPAGTVEFRDGSTVLSTVTLSGAGTATFTFPAGTTAGTHTITAVFTPASINYETSTSSGATLTVVPASTTTTLTLNNGATQVYLGARATATASVAPVNGGYPAGQFEFREGSTVLATVARDNSGMGSYVLSAELLAGSHDITARFIPSTANYVTSTSAAATLTVTPAATSSSVTLDRSATQVFAAATTVTATATVDSVNGVTPSGAFQFLDGATLLGSANTNGSGVATYTFADATSVGSHSITVRFVPTSSSFTGSTSAAKTLTVTAAATGTTVTLDRSATQVYGSGDTVTATASTSAVAGIYPAGAIEFRDGSTVLATVTTNGTGSATYTFAPNTSAGTHSISARFIPTSSNYDGSTSTAKTLIVTPTPTTVAFTLDRSATQVFGSSDAVTAQASVAELPQGGYAPGSVEFLDGSTVRGTVPVGANGIATYTFSSTLSTGDHSITVRFVPATGDIAGSTSLARTLTVTKAPTATSLTLDRSGEQTFASTERVTATATVAEVNGAVQPGSIEFRDGTTVLDTVTINASGIATYTFSANTTAGSHAITAIFSPISPSYSGSSSTPSTLTVKAAQTATSLTLNRSATQVHLGTAVTATATVAAIAGTFPAGQVEFREGSSVLATVTTNTSGIASYTLPTTLVAGTHDITVRFLPTSTNYISSTSDSSTVTVTPASTVTNLGLNNSGIQMFATGSPVTATASVSPVSGVYPAGSIVFLDGTTAVDTVEVGATGGATTTFALSTSAGAHSITARFVPATPSFTTSTSVTRTLTVSAATTTTTVSLDRSGNQVYGSPETVTATANVAAVAGVYPAGSFVFTDTGSTGTTTLATVSASETGSATFTAPSSFAVGTHTIKARFEPTSTNYSISTSAGSTITVARSGTSTTLSLSKTSQVYYTDNTITATASVSEIAGGGYAAGQVYFRDGTTILGQVTVNSSGIATYPFSRALAVGTHDITANFVPASSATSTVAGSTSAAQAVTVTTAPTETTLVLSNSGTQAFATTPAVIATATTSIPGAASFSPDGTVVFYDGENAVSGAIPVGGTKATFTFPTNTTLGTHAITAKFTPSSSSFIGSASSVSTLTVTPAATSTALSLSSASQVYLGSPTTATANVAQVGGVYPAGKIEFRDGELLLATTATDASGTATFTFASETTTGSHSITARFIPAANLYVQSTSAVRVLTVTAAPTTTTLTLDRSTQAYAGADTATATGTVAPVGGTYPAGAIQFLDGAVVIATVPTNNSGSASYRFASDFGFGDHPIRARFTPLSTLFESSTSAPQTLSVTQAQAAVAATLSTASQVYGTASPVVISASVPRVGSTYPSGRFVFLDGTVTLATVTASATGSAEYTVSSYFAAGTHPITVRFEPSSGTVTGSTSAARDLTVSMFASATSLTLNGTATQVYTSSSTVTATASIGAYGTGAFASGTFQFRDGSTVLGSVAVSTSGSASFALDRNLAAGAHTITAVFQPSSTAVSGSTSAGRVLTVTKASSGVGVTLSNSGHQGYGTSTLVTATVNVSAVFGIFPTGSVELRDGTKVVTTLAIDASGAASYTFPADLAIGEHSITAVFTPSDPSYTASTSAAQTLTVFARSTSTSLSIDRAARFFLSTDVNTAIARVNLFTGVFPAGSMEFRDGETLLATIVTDQDGYARYAFDAATPVGSHSITARFVPADPTYGSSTSTASTLVVSPAPTTTTLAFDGSVAQPLGTSTPIVATATVAPVSGIYPAGVMQFMDDGAAIGSAPTNQSGVATFAFPNSLAVGYHRITVQFVPATGSFRTSASAEKFLLVSEGPTTTSVTLSNNGKQAFGVAETVIISASVAKVAGEYPAGVFTFFDGSDELATVEASATGTATLAAPSTLAAGAHSITVRFTPSSESYLGSTSAPAILTVTSSASRVSLDLDNDGAQVIGLANTVTATAVVDDYGTGTHAGLVQFRDGSTTLASVRVDSSGVATYRFARDLALGDHSITALFVPDSSEITGASSDARTLSVTALQPEIQLVLDYDTQQYDWYYPATAIAVIYPVDGSQPEGTVTFFDGTTSMGTAVLGSDSIARFAIPATFPAGVHEVTAKFTPSAPTWKTVESEIATLTVTPASSGIYANLDRSTQEYAFPSSAKVYVQVSADTRSYPKGSAELRDGARVLGTAALDTYGFATFTVSSKLSVGTHTLTVVYLPSSTSVIPSTSDIMTLVVTGTQPPLALSLDGSGTQVFGSAKTVTATAEIAPVNGGVPAGSVQFREGTTVLGTVAATETGIVDYALPRTLAGGAHEIVARFLPTGSSTTVESSPVTLLVTAADSVASLSLNHSATQVYRGSQRVTVTASVAGVSGVTPEGTFQFADGGAALGAPVATSGGSATFTLPATLAAGAHSITALFVPSTQSASSFTTTLSEASSLSVTAAPTVTTMALDRSGTQVFGDSQTVTATATVSKVDGELPSGSVRFRDGDQSVALVPVPASGVVTYTFSAQTTAGAHSVTAAFVPDAVSNFLPSTSSAATLVVTVPVVTTTKITLSDSSQVFGTSSPVTATATVTSASGLAAGTVEFFVDGKSLSTKALAGNTVALVLDGKLAAGSHTVSAEFTAATAGFAPSVSAEAALSVAKFTAPVTLKASRTSQVYGSTTRSTLTASIGSVASAIAGGGKVTFRYGTTSTVVAVGSAGTATLTLPATTKVGTQSISATFTPTDSANTVTTVTAAPTKVTVTKAKSTATLALKATSVKVKKSSTATVTVKVTGVAGPAGTITLYNGTKKLKAYSLAAAKKGKLTITVPAFAKKATVKLKVVYSGDSNVAASTSAVKSLAVK